MEIGKIYKFEKHEVHNCETFYRFIEYKLEMKNFLVGYFYYVNKFGKGYVHKLKEDMNRMVLAPEAYQVLYGQAAENKKEAPAARGDSLPGPQETTQP